MFPQVVGLISSCMMIFFSLNVVDFPFLVFLCRQPQLWSQNACINGLPRPLSSMKAVMINASKTFHENHLSWYNLRAQNITKYIGQHNKYWLNILIIMLLYSLFFSCLVKKYFFSHYKNILLNFLCHISNFGSCMDSTRTISKCGMCRKFFFFFSHGLSLLAASINSICLPHDVPLSLIQWLPMVCLSIPHCLFMTMAS